MGNAKNAENSVELEAYPHKPALIQKTGNQLGFLFFGSATQVTYQNKSTGFLVTQKRLLLRLRKKEAMAPTAAKQIEGGGEKLQQDLLAVGRKFCIQPETVKLQRLVTRRCAVKHTAASTLKAEQG